jgi:uncharacterized protein YjdB
VTFATVGAGTGVVTGGATGFPIISYSLGGCYKTLMVTVNPSSSVGTISGTAILCQGSTSTLTDAMPGGTWTSSNPAIGTVSAYGVVKGIAAGTDTIYYTRLGCYVIQPITVNPAPAAITGTRHECSANGGNTATLADGTSGGTWASSNAAIAAVGSTGIVTAVANGIATITYTLPATGCFVTTTDTVYGPAPIAGGTTACIALATYLELNDATFGGAWSSTQTSKATISNGAVTGVAPGLDTIKYTVTYFTGFSCYVILPITVATAPGLITGNANTCIGGSTTLTDTATSGVWSSNNSSIATIGSSSGIVTGMAGGAVVVSYAKNGCTKTFNITVNTPPVAITGSGAVCSGLATTTLTDSTTGGTWSASNPNASISSTGAYTALVTGVVAGNDTISYRLGGCTVTKIMTMSAGSPSVTSIGGVPVACTGLITAMTSGGGAGTWTSRDTTIASFSGSRTSTTANILGVSAGSTVITYTRASDGCFKTSVFAVHTQPAAITGTVAICNGTSTTLSDITSGGAWTSSNTHIATVGSAGMVAGIAIGHVTITYSMPGGCGSYLPMDINTMPSTPVGTFAACVGSTATVYDSLYGGVWSSSNTGIASLGLAGLDSVVLTGVAAGTATITYTVGSCYATKAFTTGSVNPTITSSPVAACAMGTASSNISVSNGGGTWTSGAATIASVAANGTTAGRITGVSAGTVTITYTLNGCFTTQTETVFADTIPAISGSSAMCAGNSILFTESASGGGTWSSSNIGVATVGATGLVSALAGVSGSTIITFISALAGGCNQWLSVNVGNVTPSSITITTLNPMCVGNSTTFTDATVGGTWSSSNAAVAFVNSSGVIGALSAGTTNITYTLAGCYPTPVAITVNPVPAPITGIFSVCGNLSTTVLSDTSTNGTWSSSSTSVATVGSTTGVVTGVSGASGSATISYTYPSGCYATASVGVGKSTGVTISGATSLCGGSSVTLTASSSGGTWSNYNSAIASVGSATSSTAAVAGIGYGVDTVYYATAGCLPVEHIDTVDFVATIGGSFTLCLSDSMILTNATPGGAWASSNSAIATIGSTGQLNSVSGGYDTVTYTITLSGTPSTCSVSQQIWIDGLCSGRLANGATGVTNTVEDQVYTLFPNPSNGNITITQKVVADGSMQATVTNSVGAKVYSGSVEFIGGTGRLNLNTATGMYLVLLQDKNGAVQTFKVMIEQ